MHKDSHQKSAGRCSRARASFRVQQRIMLFIFASVWESQFCDSLRNRMKNHLVFFHEPILTPPDKATTGYTFWYQRMSAREQNSQKCTRFLIKSRRTCETWTYVFLANVAPKPPSCFVRAPKPLYFIAFGRQRHHNCSPRSHLACPRVIPSRQNKCLP